MLKKLRSCTNRWRYADWREKFFAWQGRNSQESWRISRVSDAARRKIFRQDACRRLLVQLLRLSCRLGRRRAVAFLRTGWIGRSRIHLGCQNAVTSRLQIWTGQTYFMNVSYGPWCVITYQNRARFPCAYWLPVDGFIAGISSVSPAFTFEIFQLTKFSQFTPFASSSGVSALKISIKVLALSCVI